jgi:hypothetical protein
MGCRQEIRIGACGLINGPSIGGDRQRSLLALSRNVGNTRCMRLDKLTYEEWIEHAFGREVLIGKLRKV